MSQAERDWAEPLRAQLTAFGRQLQRHLFQGKLDVAGVVQQTLLEASRRPPPDAKPAAKLAWLKAALRNNFQDAIRRLTAKKRDVQREQLLGSADLPAKVESPSRRLKKAEEIQELLMFLKALPSDQQDAIRLRYIEELGVEAVAIRMKRTPAAVKGLLRRGLAALRAKLASTKQA
jgi:RNA polymerase sigma factor (sigma-70 family)